MLNWYNISHYHKNDIIFSIGEWISHFLVILSFQEKARHFDLYLFPSSRRNICASPQLCRELNCDYNDFVSLPWTTGDESWLRIHTVSLPICRDIIIAHRSLFHSVCQCIKTGCKISWYRNWRTEIRNLFMFENSRYIYLESL